MIQKAELKKLAILFIFWRSFLFFLSFIADKLLTYKPSFPYADQLTMYRLPDWIFSWANFDGVHYLTIITEGYFGTGLIQAFFPLYPLLVKTFDWIQNPLLTGLLLSNVLAFGVFISLYQLLKLTDKKNIWKYISIFCLFPTSFFFGALYTESLFLVLVLQSFIFAHKKNWLAAGILAALASATRIVGILLVPALLIHYLIGEKTLIDIYTQLKNKTKREKFFTSLKTKISFKNIPTIVYILLGGVGLGSYMFYLLVRFNDPLYFFHVQSEFGGGRQESLVLYPQVVFRYLKILITARPFDLKYLSYVQEFFAGTIGLVLLLIPWKKIPLSHFFFSLAIFFIPTLTGTFSSMPRYILVSWPIYIGIGMFLQKTNTNKLFYLLSLLFLIINTILFIQGYWVA